eukprot:XP_001703758.1 predicted protein [Chlamydomonas reinhardtii]
MSELEFRDADAKRILALAPTNKWAIYAANAFTRASIVERTLFRSADEPAVARGILDELISLQGGGVQAAAGVGVGSAAGVGGSCHAGAVAGLGAGSTAADGTTTSMQETLRDENGPRVFHTVDSNGHSIPVLVREAQPD